MPSRCSCLTRARRNLSEASSSSEARSEIDATLQHVGQVGELAEVLVQALERAVGVDLVVAPVGDDLRVAIDGFGRLLELVLRERAM